MSYTVNALLIISIGSLTISSNVSLQFQSHLVPVLGIGTS